MTTILNENSSLTYEGVNLPDEGFIPHLERDNGSALTLIHQHRATTFRVKKASEEMQSPRFCFRVFAVVTVKYLSSIFCMIAKPRIEALGYSKRFFGGRFIAPPITPASIHDGGRTLSVVRAHPHIFMKEANRFFARYINNNSWLHPLIAPSGQQPKVSIAIKKACPVFVSSVHNNMILPQICIRLGTPNMVPQITTMEVN